MSHRKNPIPTPVRGETLELEVDHRRHAEIENAIRDLKYGVGVEPSPLGPLPRQRRLAGGAGDRPQPGSLDRAYRSGRAGGDHQDPPAAVLLYRRTAHPARRAASLCICHSTGPGKTSSVMPWHDCERFHSQPDGTAGVNAGRRSDPLTRLPDRLADLRQAGPRASLAARYPDNFAQHRHRGPPSS